MKPRNLREALGGKQKRSKYGAKRVEVDGISFHSKREAERYKVLKIMEKAGRIANIRLQERHPIRVTPRGGEPVLICHYVSDFVYTLPNGKKVTEDVKGFRTEVYRLKKKLFEALHGTEIHEV